MIGLFIIGAMLFLNLGINFAKDGERQENYSAGKALFGTLIDVILLYMIYNHI